MEAAAHTKGGVGGVPQKVGKEFVQADKGKTMKMTKKAGGGSLNPMDYDSDTDYYDARQKAGLPARPRGYTDADRKAIISGEIYKKQPNKTPSGMRPDPEKNREAMASIEKSLAKMREIKEANKKLMASRGKKSGGQVKKMCGGGW
jgi:hypothetical protein